MSFDTTSPQLETNVIYILDQKDLVDAVQSPENDPMTEIQRIADVEKSFSIFPATC